MNFDPGTAYPESDADDEYERDMHGSSPIATESETSPIDSDPPSTEHTPTTYGYRTSADRLPETIISEWTAEECADFIASIGVQQYADRFLGMGRVISGLIPFAEPALLTQCLLSRKRNHRGGSRRPAA
jgi:hypothetical protein